jgi:hypothetical protein
MAIKYTTKNLANSSQSSEKANILTGIKSKNGKIRARGTIKIHKNNPLEGV